MIASLPLPLPFPFELAFMQRALVAGVVVGVFAPLIGTFLVQKRMSLIGDGIGHVSPRIGMRGDPSIRRLELPVREALDIEP